MCIYNVRIVVYLQTLMINELKELTFHDSHNHT